MKQEETFVLLIKIEKNTKTWNFEIAFFAFKSLRNNMKKNFELARITNFVIERIIQAISFGTINVKVV